MSSGKRFPGAETTIRKGDAVILVISSGPVPFEMPDVIGMTADEATNLLTAKKMNITRDRAASTEVQKGRVMNQVPAAGDMVTRDDPVTLIISGGSTAVPALTGHTLQEAEEMLTKQNLTLVASMKYEDTDQAGKHGLVSASSPEADNRVAEDTPVQLTIFRYPDAARTAKLSVTIPPSEQQQQMKIRITIQAEGSSMAVESRSYTLEPEDSRTIEEVIDLPDDRNYTYTVYSGESQLEQKALTVE